MGRPLKIIYHGEEDIETVLEKSLKSIKHKRESGFLDDPYLRFLQKHALTLYEKACDAMVEEILETLYK